MKKCRRSNPASHATWKRSSQSPATASRNLLPMWTNSRQPRQWGFPSRPIKFEFNYVVSIKKNRLGLLNVEEYRDSHYSAAQFPDGIATTGLPALAPISHPSNLQNLPLTRQALTSPPSAPTWHIHYTATN